MKLVLRGVRALWSHRLRRFAANEHGNIAVMGAIFLTAAVPLAALSVDVGALYLERRGIQELADLAAISAAARIDEAEEAARTFLADNGITDVSVVSVSQDRADPGFEAAGNRYQMLVEKGLYRADPTLAPEERFEPVLSMPNAVRVTVRKAGTLYFGGSLISDPVMTATGTAQTRTDVGFTVGSRLLQLNGGILNALLNGLLGTNVSLSVMDYNALVDADINLFDFLDALGSDVGLTVGTYDDLLEAEVGLGRLIKIMAALTNSDLRAAVALNRIAADPGIAGLKIPLGLFLNLGPLGDLALGSGSSVFETKLHAMEMLTAAAAIANGENQVKLDLGVSLPGLASVTLDLAIGEPPQSVPWFAIGSTGAVTRTAQTRLYLEVTVGGSGLLAGIAVKLPLYVELAYAEARLDRVFCPSGSASNARLYVDARPGLVDLWIAEVDRASMKRFSTSPSINKVALINTPLLKVTGLAHAEIGNGSYQELQFTSRDIADQTVKTVSTLNITETLIESLLGDLVLEVKILGLELSSPTKIQNALVELLRPLSSTLDTIVYNLLAVLGVGVGQADIRVTGLRCGHGVLVQ